MHPPSNRAGPPGSGVAEQKSVGHAEQSRPTVLGTGHVGARGEESASFDEAAEKLRQVVNLTDTVDTQVITRQAPGE